MPNNALDFRMIDKPRSQEPFTFSREVIHDENPDLSYLEQEYEGETPSHAAKYRQQDARRMRAYSRGDWHVVGIRAKVDILIPAGGNSFAMYTLSSPGLWGVESDSGEKYLEEVYQEQLEELKSHLKALGKLVEGML